ncbi:MAG TPA: type II CAAX endopeptidase family protein [Candidatus Limnocylindrales bacterium]|nr:type II CAAX endopeptidase family protein [Candidatus Limnocylindrales bacterium]
MPRWPGPLLTIMGVVLAVGALAAGAVALQDAGSDPDLAIYGWLAILGAVLFTAGLLYSAIRQLRIRSHLPPERYRGPSVVVLVLLVLVLASIITAPFGADAAALLMGEGELTFLGAAVLLVATQTAMLLVSWFLVFRPGALQALPSLPGRDPAAALLTGIGWGIPAWLGATLASAGVVWLLESIGFDAEPQAAEQAIALVDPWLVVVAVVILAPIAEEIFFRGVVFNAWLREGGPRWAIFGSSALFALIHLSVVALVPIFLLGLALAWVYRRTGNLLAPIAMHATVNGISVALALLVRFDVVRLPV